MHRNVYRNEIFYLINVERISNSNSHLLKNFLIKLIVYINNIIIILYLIYLKIYIIAFGSNLKVNKIWFSTSKKSKDLYKRYSKNFEKDILLINNRIIAKDSFLILCESIKISDILRINTDFRNEIIDLLKEKKLVKFSLVLKYVYKSFYLSLVWYVFEKKYFKKVFISEKESSWGQVINKACGQTYCDIIVIPHGVEYNFLFPDGYPGDIFYTTTSKAAIDLNKVYNTDKFIFDENISKSVMKLSITEKVNANSLVYFPEGRNVKIDQNLLDVLIEDGLKPLLCIHPLDKESNYSKFNLNIIPFNKAIKKSIVISRNSTVLLEALSYNSIPISIICNQEDEKIKRSIPSLNINEIFTVNTVQNLIDLLKKVDMDNEYNRNHLYEAIN